MTTELRSKTYETNITKSYLTLYALYLTSEPIQEKLIRPGLVQVRIQEDSSFVVEGTLNARGGITGLAKLYSVLQLKEGDKVKFLVPNESELLVVSPAIPAQASSVTVTSSARKLRWAHIEPFRPENLKYWEPKYETDVYLAFGVLQKFTGYQYCCGTSKSFLEELEYKSDTKPDAILLNTVNNDYAVAEFKMRSSAFDVNHKKEDIDVLVVWDDDAIDRSILPSVVINLRELAREAALEVFEE